MYIFWKTAAGVLTAVILWINLNKSNRDISVLLTMAVCAMALIGASAFLQPVIAFFKKLQTIGNLDNDLVSVVLRIVGIGVVTEIAVLICKDAGNESMGKTLQLVSTVTALWMSIPVFESLISLLDKILGAI